MFKGAFRVPSACKDVVMGLGPTPSKTFLLFLTPQGVLRTVDFDEFADLMFHKSTEIFSEKLVTLKGDLM